MVQLVPGKKILRDLEQKSCTKHNVKETIFLGMFSLLFLCHIFWVPYIL